MLGIFWLLVIATLTGCQTSKPSPSPSTAGNSSPITKPSRHHVATPRAPAKDTKLPAPDASQTNSPAVLTTIPAPPPKQPPVVAPDSAVAKIENAPVISPPPVTPTETAPLAVANPPTPATTTDSAGRSFLSVPDTVLNPLPPADARPTLDTSRTAVSPDKIPSAVNLSRFASPEADVPVPNQPAVIRLPALDDQPPTRTEPPSLNAFFSPALPETASSTPNNSPGLHLTADNNQTSQQMVGFNQYRALPLPVPASVSWPTKVQPDANAPGLSNWLASPARAPQPAPVTTREARDNLHQKVYNFILGN